MSSNLTHCLSAVIHGHFLVWWFISSYSWKCFSMVVSNLKPKMEIHVIKPDSLFNTVIHGQIS